MILLLTLPALIPLPPAHARPSAFSLISPEDGVSVLTEVLLDWEDSTDPIHPDGLTYTITLSQNDSFEDPIYIEDITNSCCLLKNSIENNSCLILEDYIEDNSTYYWKVKAKNKFDHSFETEVRHFKTDNNANPVAAWIGGHVYNSFRNPVSSIIMRVLKWNKTFSFEIDSDGHFCGELDPENPQEAAEEIIVEINVEGMAAKSLRTMAIFILTKREIFLTEQ